MAKEHLTLNNLLTWEDIVALGDPKQERQNHYGYDFWYRCCNKNFEKKMFDDMVEKNFIKPFTETFPDLPIPIRNLDYRICFVKDKDGNWKFQLSKIFLAHWILKEIISEGQITDNEHEQLSNLVSAEDNLEQLVKELLIDYKKDICDIIYELNRGTKLNCYNIATNQHSDVTLEEEIQKRKKVNWLIRNLDKLFAYAEREIDLDTFQAINKDNFLLNLAASALLNSNVLKLSGYRMSIDEFMENLQEESVRNSINYLNNYLLMLEYLDTENERKYENVMIIEREKEGSLSISNHTLKEQLNQALEIIKKNQKMEEFLELVKPFSSYEEFLSTKVSKTWKKMQNKKLAESIRLNWELIPTGPKISIQNYPQNRRDKIFPIDQQQKQLELKKAYDLVEEKIEYFTNTNPLFELTGIETFTGYSAYMYQNGVVVFEKFFKEEGKSGKKLTVPVGNEAIYVMNFQEFADLSKYTKMELIQEISTFHNPNVKRILHTKNGSWKNRVDQVIQGEGYQQLDLEQIDTLALELAGKQKQLKK